MKRLLFSIVLSLSLVQLFAQVEDAKHEVSLTLVDMDMVLNSEHQESKILLGTGLLYSYQLNDLLFIQAGASSYETNVEDNCRFCFFNNDEEGNGFYKNKEFRVGFTVEKPSRRKSIITWIIGGTFKYGRADYRAILEQGITTFDPITFEPETVFRSIDKNVTTRYLSGGLDIGFKFYPHDNVFVALVSNVSAIAEFNIDNTISSQFFNSLEKDTRVTANVLELRTGIRF